MTTLRFSPLTSTLFLLAAVSAPSQAGFFDSDDDKIAATWANDTLLSSDSCSGFTAADVITVISKYAVPKDSKDLGVSADNLMATYMLSALSINRANICMADALDLKETKESLLEEKAILMSGTSMSEKEVEMHRKYSASASEKIMTASQEVESITPEQNLKLVVGISTFLFGTYNTYEIGESGEQLLSNLKDTGKKATSGGFGLSNLSSGIKAGFDTGKASLVVKKVVSGLPSHGENLYETGQYLMDFANSQDLELDSDATQVFNTMGGW